MSVENVQKMRKILGKIYPVTMMKLCLHKPGLGQVRLTLVRLVMKPAYVSLRLGQVRSMMKLG